MMQTTSAYTSQDLLYTAKLNLFRVGAACPLGDGKTSTDGLNVVSPRLNPAWHLGNGWHPGASGVLLPGPLGLAPD